MDETSWKCITDWLNDDVYTFETESLKKSSELISLFKKSKNFQQLVINGILQRKFLIICIRYIIFGNTDLVVLKIWLIIR